MTDGNGQIGRYRPQDALQRIRAAIESNRNSPQELWSVLRGFWAAGSSSVPVGLLRDVLEFCRAVFDSLEPNATMQERSMRIARVNGLAVTLNLQIGQAGRELTEKDNAFLARWGIAVGANTIALQRPYQNFVLSLSSFVAFDGELRQTDSPELVHSVFLYSLYTAIFALAHGTVPAGVLGVASFVAGLAMRDNR